VRRCQNDTPFYYQEARALRRLLIKGTTFGCAILYSHPLLAVNIVACHADETVGLARIQKDLVSICSHPSNQVLE